MRILIILAVALMTANHASLVQADEKSKTADGIYDFVMERVDHYGSIFETKAMAICIDWDAPTVSGIQIHQAFMHYTDPGSDGPIFVGKLAQSAKYNCKKWAKSENTDCTCQMLDKNGKNVLKAPPR